MERAIYISS